MFNWCAIGVLNWLVCRNNWCVENLISTLIHGAGFHIISEAIVNPLNNMYNGDAVLPSLLLIGRQCNSSESKFKCKHFSSKRAPAQAIKFNQIV